MNAEFSQSDIDKATRALERCRLTYRREQMALRRIGRAVIKQARKNAREQKDVQGKAFAPRLKKRKGRRKMLPNLAKKLRGKNDANRVDVGFNNRLTGRIAHTQQFGAPSEVWTGKRMNKVRGRYRDYSKSPTPKQARMLIKAGFTLKKKRGEGRKRPTTKWVIANLTQGKLFAIWRELTGHDAVPRWEINNAPRAFLGLTRHQSEQIITREVLREME